MEPSEEVQQLPNTVSPSESEPTDPSHYNLPREKVDQILVNDFGAPPHKPPTYLTDEIEFASSPEQILAIEIDLHLLALKAIVNRVKNGMSVHPALLAIADGRTYNDLPQASALLASYWHPWEALTEEERAAKTGQLAQASPLCKNPTT